MGKRLRPDKLYTISELCRLLQITSDALMKAVRKYRIEFKLKDNEWVFTGSTIQKLIDKE